LGLTAPESATACLGMALIVRFLVGKALPAATRRFAFASTRYSDRLRDEFVHLPAARIANGLLISGFLCAGVVLGISRSATVAVVSGTVPVFLAGTCIRWYRSRRRKRILSQLPILLDLIAGHVKAGHSLPESLSETVPLLPTGIREEVSWVLQKSRLGTHLIVALKDWEDRMPAEEISLIVRPLRAALPGGGNIVDLLERTRDILRRRSRTREKLGSMTAQARLQATVLTMLPLLFTAALSAIDPFFIPNLVGTPQGRTVLVAVAVLQGLGWITIRKILAVRP
jgi:tight adherence protein B